MSVDDVALVLLAAVLICLAGVLSGIETALSRVSRVKVAELAAGGGAAGTRLARVLADPPRYLNVLTLLRTAAELTAAVVLTFVCVDAFDTGWRALLVAAAVMTLASYIAVGVASRTLGRQHADRIALAGAGPALALARVLGPVPRLLILVGNMLTPGKGLREGPFSSEAELRDLVDLASERQVIAADERAMIHSVFELGDTLVREVMVPRTDIVFVERTKTVRQALSLCLRSGYSRIPVVGADTDDVVGIAYLKDLARRSHDFHQGESTETVESMMRPPTFVPDAKPVDALLREMQAARSHVAIVIDEYGGTAGMVTIEDILEEIVGEITDEYDVEVPLVEPLSETKTRVSVRLDVEAFDELYGTALADRYEDVETMGGLLARMLGRVPIPGVTVEVDGLQLTAEAPRGRRNRVATVLVLRPAPAAGAGEEQPVVEAAS